MQCPSVRPSVTFVDSVKMNKHIFNNFSPSRSHTIIVFFSILNGMAIFRREPPITGASNAGGVGTNRDYRPISGYRSMTAGASATAIK